MNFATKVIIEEGVAAFKNGKFWGKQDEDGKTCSYGFGDFHKAIISDPRYCHKPTDLTHDPKNTLGYNPAYHELKDAILVSVKRKTTIEFDVETDGLIEVNNSNKEMGIDEIINKHGKQVPQFLNGQVMLTKLNLLGIELDVDLFRTEKKFNIAVISPSVKEFHRWVRETYWWCKITLLSSTVFETERVKLKCVCNPVDAKSWDFDFITPVETMDPHALWVLSEALKPNLKCRNQ